MKRVGILLGLVCALLTPAPSASADLCARPLTAREAVSDREAAFIGTALKRDGLMTKFLIEEVIKGPLRSEVWIRESDAGIGQRVGIVAFRFDGQWMATCGNFTVEELSGVRDPLEDPGADRIPRFLIGGLFGDPQTLALDADGRVSRAPTGEGDASEIAVCPGSRFVVELISRDRSGNQSISRPVLVVRDMQSFHVVRRVALERRNSVGTLTNAELQCRSSNAGDVLLLSEGGDKRVKVYRLRGDRLQHITTLAAIEGALGPDGNLYFATKDGTIKWYAVTSGRVTTIARLPGPELDVKTLVVSADARKIAGATRRSGRYEDVIFVVDVASGEVLTKRVQLVGGLTWTRDGRLVEAPGGFDLADIRSNHQTDHFVRVYDASLGLQAEWRGWSGERAVVVGETIYGLGAIRRSAPGREGRIFGSTYTPAIVAAPLMSGPQRIVGELEGLYPVELEVLTDAGPIGPTRPNWAIVAGFAGFLVALVGFVWFRSRRPKVTG